MKVIAWSQNLTADAAAVAGAELVTKDELFGGTDILTIHLILSERTPGSRRRGRTGADETDGARLARLPAWVIDFLLGRATEDG